MDIKAFLSRHYEIDQSINAKLEQLAELRSFAERITVGVFSESRGSGGYSDRVGRMTARIVDLENEINDDIDRLIDAKAEILKMIHSLTNSTQRTLLERHYLLHEGWELISEKMGYTPRHITRLHNQAIAALDELYNGKSA